MLKVVIVDDEALARERLRRLLAACDGFEVVAEGADGRDAVSLAQSEQPDIMLLDIRMPGMDGIEAARHIDALNESPAIIFCTAYDDYALDAFAVNAVGYVLKPVRKDQLQQALMQAGKLNAAQLAAIDTQPTKKHIAIKNTAGIELVDIADISHFMADSKYVVAYHQGRESILDESLKQLEQELGASFLRIHRSCLVARDRIVRLDQHQAGHALLVLESIDQPLAVSRRHLSEVKAALK